MAVTGESSVNRHSTAPLSTSHTCRLLPSEQKTTRWLSNATMQEHLSSRIRRIWPFSGSHTRVVQSSELETTCRSSNTTTSTTQSECPSRMWRVWPLSTSHTRNVPSLELET